jgi:helix-turn-helix protein
MGARKCRAADRAGRPAMRSPGRPPVGRREHRQRFWVAIARGLPSEDAGVAAGVSPAVGSCWFCEGGGMPTLSRAQLSGRYLSFAEREELAILRAQEVGVRETARQLGRSPRRSPGSCVATPRPVAGVWRIGLRPPSGTPIGVLSVPRSPSWLGTSGFGAMCSSGWRARSGGPTAQQSGVRRSGGSVGGTGVARTAAGHTRGVRSRSPTGCRSTSPMMGPCGSPTRPSTRPCTSKVAAPCAVS